LGRATVRCGWLARRIASNIAKLPELLPPKSDEHAEKKAVRILD
jgi:uncharacterized protein YqiB (DUF1249 family)